MDYYNYTYEPVQEAQKLFENQKKEELLQAKQILEEHLEKFPGDKIARGLYGEVNFKIFSE